MDLYTFLGNRSPDPADFPQGYTNVKQDDIKARYPRTSSWQMMCFMNFWCAMYNAVYMFGISDVGFQAVKFCGVR